MVMRFLLLATAILLPQASAAIPSERQDARVIQPKALAPTRSDCPEVATYQTARPGEPLRLHNLNELPPANAYAAVYRKIGGCEVPMLVGYDIGKR